MLGTKRVTFRPLAVALAGALVVMITTPAWALPNETLYPGTSGSDSGQLVHSTCKAKTYSDGALELGYTLELSGYPCSWVYVRQTYTPPGTPVVITTQLYKDGYLAKGLSTPNLYNSYHQVWV